MMQRQRCERSSARSRGVALDVHLSPLPEVICYPAKLNQVILNLIANAIDACPTDGRVVVGPGRRGFNRFDASRFELVWRY